MFELKNKKVLITAGSTIVPIDEVRAITNIFKGKTGTRIAEYFHNEGYDVTLITSNPDLVLDDYTLFQYRTYDGLYTLMEELICNNKYDIIIHSSAVSDYKVDSVCIEDKFGDIVPINKDGKVSSSHEVIYFKCTQTKKIIDLIRNEWGFKGFLVKFKLEVGITDEELIEIATKSRITSNADMIVANCLEWAKGRAYAISEDITTSIHRWEIGQTIEEFYEHSIRHNG